MLGVALPLLECPTFAPPHLLPVGLVEVRHGKDSRGYVHEGAAHDQDEAGQEPAGVRVQQPLPVLRSERGRGSTGGHVHGRQKGLRSNEERSKEYILRPVNIQLQVAYSSQIRCAPPSSLRGPALPSGR